MQTHADTSARRAALILIAAGALLVVLFCAQIRTSLQLLTLRPGVGTTANEQFGNGLVVRSDGVGYYAWLRSTLIDGDWQFDNEFDDFNALGSGVPRTRTPAGFRANQWSVGPACVWAVAVLPCHALVSVGAFGNYAADGYSLPYQLAVGCTGVVAGLLALVFMYGICRRFADPVAAAGAAACVALGSTFAFYTAVEPSMGHGLGATALLLFVRYWLRDFGDSSARRWFALGALLGVAAIMRWQLLAFGIVLIGEWLWVACATRRSGRFVQAGAALAVGLVIGVLPQLVAWRVVYGAWLVEPMPLARNWLSPDVWRVLGSTDRGFIYWTPITLLAAVGMLVAVARREPSERRVQIGLLLLGVALQVFALAVVSGPGVYLGAAYGYRFLTESAVLLAPGLAVLLALRRWAVGVGVLACVLVGWNLLMMGAYRYGMIEGTSVSPAELTRATRLYAMNHGRWDRWETVPIAVAASFFFALVLTSRRRVTPAVAAAEPSPPPSTPEASHQVA